MRVRMERIVPVLFLAGAGCVSVQPRSMVDPDADFRRYRTFASAPAPTERPEALPGYGPLAAARIQRMIETVLEEKGYRKAEADEADLVVAFRVTGQPRTDIQSFGGWYYWPEIYTTHYVEASFVVDVFDRKTKRAVWQGWAGTRLFGSGFDEGKTEQVVRAVMSRFPPPAASN